ncbi:DUF6404 family protein [Idiomarina sp. HP20-50]|uniref:DUF6404 family protein n=1 Tax=Idiomarina sp. HP20-50 TaxID=3070813 RepID=UPI00294B2C83|nr:DUF6404 family protein [Idiomarina sp. HP20-50]MDV6315312.1 DUF6404 family protein [Idiomarina sp. HP20-50]
MSFEERKRAALDELARSKIWQSNYQPPLLLFMWWLRKEAKPPHYNSFLRNTLSFGVFFGFFWGVVMWLLAWRTTGMPVLIAVLGSLLAGGLFGLSMALYYRISARKNNLPKWENLMTTENEHEI